MNDLHRKTWDWITHDLCGMLLGGNTVWGRVSIVGLVLLCAMVGASHAQQRAIAYPLVDRSHAMAVHRRVEQWVVDVKIDTSEQPIFASGAVGLKVTLRWDGRRIGEGQWTGPLDQKSVDLIFVAQLAANRAIGQVQRRHEQNKGKSDATLQSITAKLQVDVQIARQVKPIILAANAARDEIYSTFSPGYHGLVMTTPSKKSERTAWVWPANALARNMSGKVQLTSLLSKLDQPRSMIPMIARANGPQLGRFEVIHVVRPQRHQPVTHLVRGNVLLPPQGLDAATLDAMAHRLAAHLRRRQRQDGSMTGRFLPTRDQYVETKASSIEQALTIYALARWLGYLEPDSITTTQRLATQSAIGRAAQHLAGELIIPLGEQDTAACALTLMALIDCPSLVDRKALRNALLRRILARQNQDGSFQSGNEQNAPPLPAKYRALPLLALAKLYKKTHDKALLDPIRRASKWLDGPGKSRDMVMLTWLNQANNLLRKSGEPGERDLAGDDQLMREAIDVLLKKQVRQTSELAGADVVGGFDFAGTGLQPGPDWTTGYGILFLATTLNRDRGGDEVRVILSAALAARFVAQLMFDEPGCYYVPSPEDVLGAVRKSLADNEVSAAPSAVALLAVMELQNAMAQWQKRAAVPKQ